MKNKLAIYLSVLAMAIVITSCANGDDEGEYPYAYVKSFGVENITSSYPSFTDDGKDTLVVKTISGDAFPFTINQASGEIYNNDSLPYATDLSKVVVNMDIDGIAAIYVDESASYEYFSIADSLDFTSPRKLRITSLSGNYSKYYTVSVNAHKVNPDLMEWKKAAAPSEIIPEKAVEFNGDMLVFGKTDDGRSVVVSTPVYGDVSWSETEITALPQNTDFSTVHVFDGLLYVVADGDLYASSDAMEWYPVLQGNALLAIVGASDADGLLWVASADNIYCSADGKAFETIGELPVGFPLYGISTVSYPLVHNDEIICNMLVGYVTAEKNGTPKVWCKLSNYESWVEYDNDENPYPCPALAGLTVLRYANSLYALGGKGEAGGVKVDAFASFYVSNDNGIVWKASEDYYQRLPMDLQGDDSPFVATVDSGNYMWIITSGKKATVWRGILNYLSFKE